MREFQERAEKALVLKLFMGFSPRGIRCTPIRKPFHYASRFEAVLALLLRRRSGSWFLIMKNGKNDVKKRIRDCIQRSILR